MKAFVVEHYGKDGLRAADVPEPEVGDGDVLVKVSAASVNPLDKMVRNGEFKRLLKYRTPFVLGHDVAGVVTRVGSAVRDFQVGDEVYARPRDLRIGTFAEYIAIDQDDVAPKPASLTLHEAAAVPLVSLAAWQALVDRAHVKPGQKVLVHAGSGGLGSTVIQLAKHLGATVATTASGENAELVRSLGADVVVDYTKEDFAEVLSGYDVVLDSLGGENLEKSLTVLKPGGQAIGVAGPPDPGFAKQLGAPKFMGVVMGLLSRKVRKQARKLGVSYSFLFMQANGAQLRELAALYDAGHLRPVIDKTFPFDQTLEALAYVEQGRANGKGRVGRVRSKTLPGSILRSQMSWIRSGRNRRTRGGTARGGMDAGEEQLDADRDAYALARLGFRGARWASSSTRFRRGTADRQTTSGCLRTIPVPGGLLRPSAQERHDRHAIAVVEVERGIATVLPSARLSTRAARRLPAPQC